MPYVTRATPPPAGTRVTMKDVAAALGVSTATVSRALQDDPAISAATKSAVLEVAQRVQYRPSAAARRLRTQSTSLVGVVVQSVGDGYIGDVVLGIQGRAREFGYQPLFFAAEGQPGLESEALDVFLSEQVTELIAVSPTGKPQLLRRAVAEGMQVAVINGDQSVPARHFAEVATGNADDKILKIERARNSPISDIRFDDAAAGRLATEYLISLGHRTLRPPARARRPLRACCDCWASAQALSRARDVAPAGAVPAASPVMQRPGGRGQPAILRARQPAGRDGRLRRHCRRRGAASGAPGGLAGA